MDQSLKKILHKIWDKYQVYDESLIDKYLIGSKENKFLEFRKEFRNWLGGNEIVKEKVDKYLSQTQRAQYGGYDFEFKPLLWDVNTSDGDMWVEMDSILVDPNGKVTLDGYDGNTYKIGEVRSGKKFTDEDNISQEIGYEIHEIINEQLVETLVKNFGVELSEFEHLVYDDQAFDKSLQENISRIKEMMGLITEGLHDTSWENDKGDKITLMDLLSATEDIPVQEISVEELKPHLLSWDGDKEEIKKIENADLQYPILIFVEDDGSFISIIDGHHRAQKAVRKGLETIKAKIILINSLPKEIRKVFGHMGKQEQNESEITERCWKGYTQKGMKTMFGKRYPNCVKKTK